MTPIPQPSRHITFPAHVFPKKEWCDYFSAAGRARPLVRPNATAPLCTPGGPRTVRLVFRVGFNGFTSILERSVVASLATLGSCV